MPASRLDKFSAGRTKCTSTMSIRTWWNIPALSIYKEYLNHTLGLTLSTPGLVISCFLWWIKTKFLSLFFTVNHYFCWVWFIEKVKGKRIFEGTPNGVWREWGGDTHKYKIDETQSSLPAAFPLGRHSFNVMLSTFTFVELFLKTT